MSDHNGLKRCPFCAEEIQAAAIVCRFCGRDLSPTAPAAPVQAPPAPVPTRKRPGRTLVILLVLVAALVLGGLYVWATSAFSVDPVAAQNIVDDFTRDGRIIAHGCNPNFTVLKEGFWESLPPRTRENFMNGLARVCISQGAGPEMVVGDTRGRQLAEFNGWSIVE